MCKGVLIFSLSPLDRMKKRNISIFAYGAFWEETFAGNPKTGSPALSIAYVEGLAKRRSQ